MLPVAVSLAASLGLLAISAAALATLWLFAVLWLGLLWRIEQHQEAGFARLDAVIRLAVIAALVALALLALNGSGPLQTGWLALKALLFALAITCGLVIRRVFAPFGPAFAQLVSTGSTPDIERTIDGCLQRTRPFVIVIWLCLIGAAALGVIKPSL
jgi:hypothetical protein